MFLYILSIINIRRSFSRFSSGDNKVSGHTKVIETKKNDKLICFQSK